jgi:hypothetical protein
MHVCVFGRPPHVAYLAKGGTISTMQDSFPTGGVFRLQALAVQQTDLGNDQWTRRPTLRMICSAPTTDMTNTGRSVCEERRSAETNMHLLYVGKTLSSDIIKEDTFNEG